MIIDAALFVPMTPAMMMYGIVVLDHERSHDDAEGGCDDGDGGSKRGDDDCLVCCGS